MKRIILLMIGLTLLISSCKKEENYICYSIQQTQCADPWGYGNNDIETINLLRNYLSQQGIQSNKIVLKTTSGSFACAACICPSGKTFFITAPQNDSAGLAEIGFMEGVCE